MFAGPDQELVTLTVVNVGPRRFVLLYEDISVPDTSPQVGEELLFRDPLNVVTAIEIKIDDRHNPVFRPEGTEVPRVFESQLCWQTGPKR